MNHSGITRTIEEKLRDQQETHAYICHKIEAYFDYQTAEVPETHPAWFKNLKRCGEVVGRTRCRGCNHYDALRYSCSQKYCPMCNWKITRKRKLKLGVWARHIRNPMHLILTQKNFPDFTKEKLFSHSKNLTKIRRHKLFDQVKGGVISIETTNGITGWHLHSHWLIDCAFLDIKKIAIAWGKLIGQEFGIVRFTKAKNFVNEVAKYVCKPKEMIKWTGSEIYDFIKVCRRRRFFIQFGSILKESKSIREEIKFIESASRNTCACKKCGGNLEMKFNSDHKRK